MTDIPPVQLGHRALTEQQRRATEIALYRMADLINRLLSDGLPYTKLAVHPQQLAPLTGGQ